MIFEIGDLMKVKFRLKVCILAVHACIMFVNNLNILADLMLLHFSLIALYLF